MLLEGDEAVGVAAGCPTEEEVTCKMEAAELEKIAPQSVVGDSSGLVGLKNEKFPKYDYHNYSSLNIKISYDVLQHKSYGLRSVPLQFRVSF